MGAHVLVVEFDLHIPLARSLKERRSALRPILDRARHRLPVSVAETGPTDRWQVATLTAAVVSGSPGVAEDVMNEMERIVWGRDEVEVCDTHRTWVELD